MSRGRAVLRWMVRSYLVISAAFFTGWLVLFPLDGLLSSRITETHQVLGYAARPSVRGPMQTVIVGEIEEHPDYPEGVPCVYAEVQVVDLKKHPVGSPVTYSLCETWIRGERGWGQIAEE